jgi:hypothetical protein
MDELLARQNAGLLWGKTQPTVEELRKRLDAMRQGAPPAPVAPAPVTLPVAASGLDRELEDNPDMGSLDKIRKGWQRILNPGDVKEYTPGGMERSRLDRRFTGLQKVVEGASEAVALPALGVALGQAARTGAAGGGGWRGALLRGVAPMAAEAGVAMLGGMAAGKAIEKAGDWFSLPEGATGLAKTAAETLFPARTAVKWISGKGTALPFEAAGLSNSPVKGVIEAREARVAADKVRPPEPGEAAQANKALIDSIKPGGANFQERMRSLLTEKEAPLSHPITSAINKNSKDPATYYKFVNDLQAVRGAQAHARTWLDKNNISDIYGDRKGMGPLVQLGEPEARELGAYLVAKREISDWAGKSAKPFLPQQEALQQAYKAQLDAIGMRMLPPDQRLVAEDAAKAAYDAGVAALVPGRIAENVSIVNALEQKYLPYAQRYWDKTEKILMEPEVAHTLGLNKVQAMRAANPFFVPFRGEASPAELGVRQALGQTTPGGILDRGNLLKSQSVLPKREPVNPLETLQHYVEGTFQGLNQNKLARNIAGLAETGVLEKASGWETKPVGWTPSPKMDPASKEAARLVQYWENGEKRYMEMPLEAASAAKNLNPGVMGDMVKAVNNYLINPQKLALTGIFNPEFELKQNIWQIPMAMWQSRNPLTWLKDTVQALPTAYRERARPLGIRIPGRLGQSPAAQVATREAMSAGGVPGSINQWIPESGKMAADLARVQLGGRGQYLFTEPAAAAGRIITGRVLKPFTGMPTERTDLETLKRIPALGMEGVRRAQDFWSAFSEASRSGMHSSSKKWWQENAARLGSNPADAEAATAFANFQATNAFGNFNQRGTLAPVLSLIYPYANAQAQGATSLVRMMKRNVKEDPISFAWRTGGAILALSIVPKLYNMKDPRRQAIVDKINNQHQGSYVSIVVDPTAPVDEENRHTGTLAIPIDPSMRWMKALGDYFADKLFMDPNTGRRKYDPMTAAKVAQTMLDAFVPVDTNLGRGGPTPFTRFARMSPNANWGRKQETTASPFAKRVSEALDDRLKPLGMRGPDAALVENAVRFLPQVSMLVPPGPEVNERDRINARKPKGYTQSAWGKIGAILQSLPHDLRRDLGSAPQDWGRDNRFDERQKRRQELMRRFGVALPGMPPAGR